MTIQPSPSIALLSPERESSRRGDFFLREEWRELIARVYGYTPLTLTTKDGAGNITGALPLALVRSPLGRRHLIAFPFSDYCPLVAEDEAAATNLVEQALALNKRLRSGYLELRTGPSDILARRDDFIAGDLYVRWLLSLGAGADAVWKTVRKPVQRQVEKAERFGVRIVFAQSRSDVTRYYQLHVRTRTRKHGMPAQPLRYFRALWDIFADDGTLQILFAEYEGVVIAGIVVLASGTIARYAYGASDERYLHLAPNNLLMWTAIRWASEHGYSAFDFGRTARDNQGLMQFKRGWGAIEEPLTYFYSPKQSGLAATPEHSWKYRLATACWKWLPLSVAGPLGGSLYRFLG
jgi:CelD/BcsL family acetyltransferase involved in cellulose biosynthesis